MSLPAEFFDTIRPLFYRKRMSAGQVDGCRIVAEEGLRRGLPLPFISYPLSTVFHETGQRMQPVREGFAKNDAEAMAAVAKLFYQKRISRNYAARDPRTGQSYYGRGPVQITHYDNYLKFERRLGIPLTTEPDLALDWEVALQILYTGMLEGMFRAEHEDDDDDSTPGRAAMNDYLLGRPTEADYTAARNIINGDIRRNGRKIAGYAMKFEEALHKVELPPMNPFAGVY